MHVVQLTIIRLITIHEKCNVFYDCDILHYFVFILLGGITIS